MNNSNDDSLDTIFDWLCLYIRPLANYWFKLMNWLVIVAALMAAHKTSQNQFLFFLSSSSQVIFLLYILFESFQYYFDWSGKFHLDERFSPKFRAIVSLIISLITFYGAFEITSLAADTLMDLAKNL